MLSGFRWIVVYISSVAIALSVFIVELVETSGVLWAT